MFSQFAFESIKMCQSCLLGLDKQVDLQQTNQLAVRQRRVRGRTPVVLVALVAAKKPQTLVPFKRK